jgi:hypothetical protein
VIAARSGSPIDQPGEYSTTRRRRWPCSWSQFSTAWVLAADQQAPVVPDRDLRDRLAQDVEVVGGGICPGVTCALGLHT